MQTKVAGASASAVAVSGPSQSAAFRNQLVKPVKKISKANIRMRKIQSTAIDTNDQEKELKDAIELKKNLKIAVKPSAGSIQKMKSVDRPIVFKEPSVRKTKQHNTVQLNKVGTSKVPTADGSLTSSQVGCLFEVPLQETISSNLTDEAEPGTTQVSSHATKLTVNGASNERNRGHMNLFATNEPDFQQQTGTVQEKRKGNKDSSSNFNDIEEKGSGHLLKESESGWFTTAELGTTTTFVTKTPVKTLMHQQSDQQLYEASHQRGQTASSEMKVVKRQLHLLQNSNNSALEPPSLVKNQSKNAPLIKRVPDSDISQRSRRITQGSRQQVLDGAMSERYSELTDDQMMATGAETTTCQINSLESLQSTGSCVSANDINKPHYVYCQASLKNVFSQSQKITNIAARYINIQDDRVASPRVEEQPLSSRLLEEKGTPRFNRQLQSSQQKGSGHRNSNLTGLQRLLRKKKSQEGVTERDSTYGQAPGAPAEKQARPIIAGTTTKRTTNVKNRETGKHLRGTITLPEDQLSGTQDESSISSLTQQKDMKSLLGILQKHQQKQTKGQLRQGSNLKNITKLHYNLYTGSSNGTGHATANHTAPQTLPPTPNSTGNAVARESGFGSAASQQSRSFNIGMQNMQKTNSKKKIQPAKSSNAIQQWKNQNKGILKNTFAKVLQSKQQQVAAATGSKKQAQGAALSKDPTKSGAHSQREQSTTAGLQLMPSSNGINDLKIVTNSSQTSSEMQLLLQKQSKPSTFLKNSGTDTRKLQQTQKSTRSQKPESQHQRLFQKQLSQTIKLTGLSSGISPKASGDIGIDFMETHRSSGGNFFKALRTGTSKDSSSAAIKIPVNQAVRLTGGLGKLDRDGAIANTDTGANSARAAPQKEKPRYVMHQNNTGSGNKKILAQKSSISPRRARDPSPRVFQKHLIDHDEVELGPRLATLPSTNKGQPKSELEKVQLAIREEKKQRPRVPPSLTYTMRKQSSSPPRDSLGDTMGLIIRHHPQHRPPSKEQTKPFQIFAKYGGAADADDKTTIDANELEEDDAAGEANEDEDDDDCFFEEGAAADEIQTILQTTQRSQHPVANFNESHPTQQIQGMSMKKNVVSGAAKHEEVGGLPDKQGPGNRMESSYLIGQQHMRERKHAKIGTSCSPSRNHFDDGGQLTIEQQDTYRLPESESLTYFNPANLLRAESIQSMSNVVDKDLPINQIHRGSTNFKKTNTRNNHINKSDSTKVQFNSAYQISYVKKRTVRRRNILQALLQDGILHRVLKYLSIRWALLIKDILHSKLLKKHTKLHDLYEQEFLKYVASFRSKDPISGGKRSEMCRLVTMYYLSTLNFTDERQDQCYYRIAYKLRNGRVKPKGSLEVGVGFEIEKDIDRTFLDSTKFNESHRHSLSIVLRTIAELQKDVGYVQGLNFIIGNLLIMMEHREPVQAQKTALVAFLTFIFQLEIKEFYTDKMLGLKEAIFKLECLLYNEMPEVYLYLAEQNIPVEYFASQWFLTVFQYDIDDVEQSGLIMLMAFIFGPKVFFQIAFQLILSIRAKLVCMSMEQALIYLKDFAGEPQFRKSTFLLEALKNDRISNELINDLGKIHRKMLDRSSRASSTISQQPLAMRVKFLRGTKPGKVNIKVIWGSSSQQDLLSNSNSLASMQNFQVVDKSGQGGLGSGVVSPSRHDGITSDKEGSTPIIIEDVPEMINSTRANNLSSKMSEILNQSIERKQMQLPFNKQSQSNMQRTFLEPAKTILTDLLKSQHKQGQQKQYTSEEKQRIKASKISPFQLSPPGNDFIEDPLWKADKMIIQNNLLFSVSPQDSMELLRQTVPEEAVASEDVDGDDSQTRHFFDNKELVEHGNVKRHGNLHQYQQESAFEMATKNFTSGKGESSTSGVALRGISQKRQVVYPNPSANNKHDQTRSNGMVYGATKHSESKDIFTRKALPVSAVAGAPQGSSNRSRIPIAGPNQPKISQKAQRSPSDGGDCTSSSSCSAHCDSDNEDIANAQTIYQDDHYVLPPSSAEKKEDRTPKMKLEQMSPLSNQKHQEQQQTRRQRPVYRPHRFVVGGEMGGKGGGSMSPPKQQMVDHQSNGFNNFFLKLNPFAVGGRDKHLQKKNNSIEHSSEESDGDYLMIKTDEDDMTMQEVLNFTPASSTHQHKKLINLGDDALEKEQVDEDDLLIGNEQGSREPPLFMSPQTAYRKYQKQQVMHDLKAKDRHDGAGTRMSQDFSAVASTSHRSPRALQPHHKKPVSNRHRKTATGIFNSRQVHYPEQTVGATSRLSQQNDQISNVASSKKPSQKQKRQFAELLNLERLNSSKGNSTLNEQPRNGPNSKAVSKRSAVQSRPSTSLTASQIAYQHSENIPESEQKEQRVGNISLYSSTNPKNVKKRPELVIQAKQPSAPDSYQFDNSWQQQSKPDSLIGWDEDHIMNPRQKVVQQQPRTALPVGAMAAVNPTIQPSKNQSLKQTSSSSSKMISATNSSKELINHTKMVRQFKMVQQKRPRANDSFPNEIAASPTMLKQSSSQEEMMYQQLVKQKRPRKQDNMSSNHRLERYHQDLRSSKQKKCMGQLNQSLEEAKGTTSGAISSLLDKSTLSQQAVLGSGADPNNQLRASSALDQDVSAGTAVSHKVLKESRSHDRDTLLRKLVKPKLAKHAERVKAKQRLFQEANDDKQYYALEQLKLRADAPQHQENLQEVEEDQFADGKIPQANISSYNSHQSNNKLVFKQNVNRLAGQGTNYNSSNSANLLDETFVMSNANNIVFRQELRYSKAQQQQHSASPSGIEGMSPMGADITPPEQQEQSVGNQSNAYSRHHHHQQQPQSLYHQYAGKTSVQRQSLQVQGHQGDKVHDEEQIPH